MIVVRRERRISDARDGTVELCRPCARRDGRHRAIALLEQVSCARCDHCGVDGSKRQLGTYDSCAARETPKVVSS